MYIVLNAIRLDGIRWQRQWMGVDRKGMIDSSVDKFTSLKVNNIPNERGMDLL